jgi:hypothetical protein
MSLPTKDARSNVIRLYRTLMKYAGRMPSAEKEKNRELIMNGFRSTATESDTSKIEGYIKRAQSTLGYLKMVTPKKSTDQQTGSTKVIYGDGNGGTTRKAYSNWTGMHCHFALVSIRFYTHASIGSNMDPDSVARHYQGLKRAGFNDNSHAKGIF